ncbi:HAD family hydrolase [bacterium]|nr:HAD family hydrolase [bacterium]
MRYDHFIFDLDGTLVDSSAEIHEAAASVCSAKSLEIPSIEYIRRMTGSPPRIFFLDHGCDETDVEDLVVDFRAHLASHAGDPECVFPSVVPLLEHLRQLSIRMSLATTKPTQLASNLLERYGLSSFFSHVQGTDPPLQHKPHPDILLACISKFSTGKAVMVGDTVFDVNAAHSAGIDSIAVCSGAHSSEQLSEVRPNFLLASLQGLTDIMDLSS